MVDVLEVDGPGLSNGFTHDEDGMRDILSNRVVAPSFLLYRVVYG